MRFLDKQVRELRQRVLDKFEDDYEAGEIAEREIRRIRKAFLFHRRAINKELEEKHLPAAYADKPEAFAMSGDVVGEIDWDKLADFIERILPVVLEFIKQLVPLFI